MTRGRDARHPLSLPRSGWLDILARCWTRLGELHLGLISAGIAFFGILSLVPAFSAIVALVGLVYDPVILAEQTRGLFSSMFPPSAADLMSAQLTDIADTAEESLTFAAVISIGVALWLASNATDSLMQGLAMIYEETETRGFFKRWLVVIGLTIALILALCLTVLIVAALPTIAGQVAAGPLAKSAATVLRWPLIFLVAVTGVATLFRHGPNRRKARWRWLSPGAVLGCTLWVAATFGFSYYVQTFGNYNEVFGTLAGVVVLLTWFWLSAFIVLLAALFDAETEAQTAQDSTIGPDRPMGLRGATKADTLGAARGEEKTRSTA